MASKGIDGLHGEIQCLNKGHDRLNSLLTSICFTFVGLNKSFRHLFGNATVTDGKMNRMLFV